MTISQGPPDAALSFPPLKDGNRSTATISENRVLGTTVSLEPDRERYIVASPYTEKEHLLDLESVDAENRLLALALTRFRCLRPDYATAPYPETFNWTEIVETVKALAMARTHRWRETSFFIVAFRSQIPPTTIYAELGTLDKAAHAEATASGGFLKYWFGTPDTDGRNLATCIWRSQEDAKKGGAGPAHREAAESARSLYSHWKIDRHKLTISDDVEGWELSYWNE